MEPRGQILEAGKGAFKKLELLRMVQEKALEEGVLRADELEGYLVEGEDYSPSFLFPQHRILSPEAHQQAYRSLEAEARASQALGVQHKQALSLLSAELFAELKDFSAQVRSVGEELEELQRGRRGRHLFIAGAHSRVPIQDLAYRECYESLSGELVLPLKERQEVPIQQVRCFVSPGLESALSFSHFHVGQARSAIGVLIEAELDQQETVNHLAIPYSLPLPADLLKVELLDYSRKVVELIDGPRLRRLTQANPCSLECFFSPVRAKYVRLTFSPKLDPAKVGLVIDELVAGEKAKIGARWGQLISRLLGLGSLPARESESLVEDSLGTLFNAGQEEEQESVAVGASVRVFRTRFEIEGRARYQLHTGDPLRRVLSTGKVSVPDEDGLYSGAGTPAGAIYQSLLVSTLSQEDELLGQFTAPIPRARPFSSATSEIIVPGDFYEKDGRHFYDLRFPCSDLSQLTVRSLSRGMAQASGIQTHSDPVTGISSVSLLQLPQAALHVSYPLLVDSTPSLLRPYRITQTGGLSFATLPEKESLDLLVELKRAEHLAETSPILHSLSISGV